MVIGFIYKIYDNTNGNVYYGSTKDTLSKRMAGHRTHYKRWVAGKTKCCKSFDIIKNEDYAYSLVEQVEYENRMELLQRERWYIENNECVNKNVPARTKKESHKAYREEHKEERNEYSKEYYIDNIETEKERVREYYHNNREHSITRNRKWKDDNKEKLKIQRKENYDANREEILAKQREYRAKKKAEKNEMNV